MSGWRDQIVRRFVPGVARVTAVSDPDGLLRDPGVIRAIQAKGLSLVQFEDSVSFRFDYEIRFRAKWDRGESAELVVVFKPEEHDFETLPSDVLAQAQRLSFSLKDLFPRLSYAVVAELETVYYEALFAAQKQHATQTLDEVQTRGFTLRHVFGIEPTIIKSVPDLLRMLCQRHYAKASIPAMLDDHLIAWLRQNPVFQHWPLDIIVRNRSAFWAFLSERWPIFVRASKGGQMRVREEPPTLRYPGPSLLPFDHDDIRVYLDNLFEDGLLTPVAWDWAQATERTWIRVGLLGNLDENTDLRFRELCEHLRQESPAKDAPPQAWLTYAMRYAQANRLWTLLSPAARQEQRVPFSDLQCTLNGQFFAWLTQHYGALFNYPSSSPLMVHHIPGFMAHRLASKKCQRAAFILVDGLAIEQWLVLKESLQTSELAAELEESALFAWIPTITPVSRQAAFAGKIPRYLAETLGRTDRDEVHWRQFWADRAFRPGEIGFTALAGDEADLGAVEDLCTSQTRVLAITLYKIDKIMHGMQLGRLGMAGQTRTWAGEGFFVQLVRKLRGQGFDVIISSDHGNTEALGMGRPSEGVLSDKRGERCRIYSDSALQQRCRTEFPSVQQWQQAGLPDALSILLAPYGQAFAAEGATLICHGGAALEEVCVPFIKVAAATP